MLGEIHGRLTLGGYVTALDTGAVANPGVAGINQLLQIEVREDFFGKVRARADDTRIDQIVDSASRLEKLACGRFSDNSSIAAGCAPRAKGATFLLPAVSRSVMRGESIGR
jgi:hypothetical protein